MTGDFERRRIPALLKRHYGESDWPPDEWNPADFLHCFGTVPGALLYAALLVPEFVEVEGCVFLKNLGVQLPGGWEALARHVRQARAASPQALRAFLESCNWIEIPHLFSDCAGGDEDCAALAALTVEAWRARLLDRFPGRRFEARVIGPEESGGGVAVGFVEA